MTRTNASRAVVLTSVEVIVLNLVAARGVDLVFEYSGYNSHLCFNSAHSVNVSKETGGDHVVDHRRWTLAKQYAAIF